MYKYIIIFVLISQQLFSQTGINTTTPKATLDVNIQQGYLSGDKAGITVPQLTGAQIEAMTTAELKAGTLIYSTEPSTNAIKNITTKGFWVWNGSSWQPIYNNLPRFFYSPAIQIDTTVTNGTIDLYNNYKNQFTVPMASSAGSSGTLPVYQNNQLEYYVTWYDATVFSSVAISAEGLLSYTVIAANSSKPTYMNVVFLVKQ